MRAVSIQNRWWRAIAFSFAMLAPTVGQSQTLTQAGTIAGGISNWGYFPCTDISCQPTGGVMSITEVGGNGINSSSTAFTGVAPGANEAPFTQYLASAQLQGILALAQHKAMAQSQVMTGTPPGYTGLCCYYYDVNAYSNALQWYTFSGTQPETFTLSFTIDAILEGNIDPLTGFDYGIFAGASGGISIYDGVVSSDPGLALEFPLGSPMGFWQVVLDGTMADATGYVTGSGSVTFTVNPGTGFFLSSFLSASVPQQVPGTIIADASNTMNIMFTQGNTGLLQAQLPGVRVGVVPEPSTYALMSAGLAAMALLARRRRTQHAV